MVTIAAEKGVISSVKHRMVEVFEDNKENLADLEEVSKELATLVRRVERVRTMCDDFRNIELSPYMQSMLKMVGRSKVVLPHEKAVGF